jgi:hypothetical protein
VLAIPCLWLPNGIVVGRKLMPGWVPVPLKVMTWVVGVELSVIVMVALRALAAVGVNVAATTQLADAARTVVFVHCVPLDGTTIAKSPGFVPPSAILLRLRFAFPVFVSVTVICEVATPTLEFPNGIVFPLKLATGWIAVPLRVTRCGLVASGESEIESVAVLPVPPAAPGWKITLTTQLPVVAGTFAPVVQVLVPKMKSPGLVPLIVGVLEIVTVVPVGLLRVTAWGELCVPTACEEKVSVVGVAFTLGFTPFPDKVTVGEFALVWMVAVSELAPVFGENLMYTTHEPVNADSGLAALQAFRVWAASTL